MTHLPVRYEPGILVPDEPFQERLPMPYRFKHKGAVVRQVATFEMEAKVLGVKWYRFDRGASVSPVDLALGWGPMSDQAVVDPIKIRQNGRFYFWHVRSWHVSRATIAFNSANMHLIPADGSVKGAIKKARKGQLIHLKGYLVNVEKGRWNWNSSLTRRDTGDGACEVVYVEEFSVIDR